MRIVRVLGRANVGGPARTVIALCRRLVEHGFETRLLVGESAPGEGDLLQGVTDLDVVRVPELRRRPGLFDRRAVPRIRALMDCFAPHLVHTHAFKAGWLGRRAAAALTRPPRIVHTFHGHVLDGYFPRPVAAGVAALERSLARQSDALVAVSPRVRDDLCLRHRVAPCDRFTIIDNGIDLEPYRAADAQARRDARRRLQLTDAAAPALLVPARLAPIKGHDLLFAALRRLPPATRPIDVVLLGDGPSRARLEARARSLPEDVRCHFHGFRHDLPEVLPAADAVVLASRNEGMPIALIEAMASGIPVMSTAVGGVPDLIEHGVSGLLATPGDPASLAFCLARVLTDLELRRALGENARRAALERHDLERVIRRHVDLYGDLLARSR